MRDVCSLAAQDEVVVLAAVEFAAEAPGLFEERATVSQEMRDVVAGQQQVRRPVGLEERADAAAVPRFLVFVRVNDVEIGLLVEELHYLQEGIWLKLVIVVQHRDEFACRSRERRVAGAGDAAVFSESDDLNPVIEPRVFGQHTADVRLRRGVVGEAELPVRIDLRQHGVDRLAQPALPGVVDRSNDADDRTVGERGAFFLEGLAAFRREGAALEPLLVLVLERRGVRFSGGAAEPAAQLSRGCERRPRGGERTPAWRGRPGGRSGGRERRGPRAGPAAKERWMRASPR